jgi:hypothetical protein
MRRLLLCAVLGLAACEAPQQRLDAAEDVRSFLLAAREGDRAGFDRHLDREALKAQLSGEAERIFAGQTRIPAGAREAMLERMVDGFGPEMFQLATQGAGPLAERTPTAPELAAVLRPVGDDRVCLPTQPGAQNCAATFENQDGTWRLVAIDVSAVRVGAAALPRFQDRFPAEAER